MFRKMLLNSFSLFLSLHVIIYKCYKVLHLYYVGDAQISIKYPKFVILKSLYA